MVIFLIFIFAFPALAQIQIPLTLQPVVVAADPHRVWTALTDTAAIRQWAVATSVEQEFTVGGCREWIHPDTNIVQNIHHIGTFTAIEPYHRLGYWVMMDAQPIHFLITLEPESDSTSITIHAENFGEGKDGERRRNVSAIYWYQRFPHLREFVEQKKP